MRRLCIFRCASATLVFSTSPSDCQHMILLSLSLYCMCRLSQISGEDSYIHISSSVSSFVQTFLPAMFAVLLSTHDVNYTGFLGLVQVAAESECDANLHGHRKCSQSGCPLVTVTLVSRLSKVVTRERAPLQRSREGLARCFLSRATPALGYVANFA